jgi:hypothetical protein
MIAAQMAGRAHAPSIAGASEPTLVKDEDGEQWFEYKVWIQRPEVGGLGIELSQANEPPDNVMTVLDVRGEGAAEAWNSQQAAGSNSSIEHGDRLMNINGTKVSHTSFAKVLVERWWCRRR